MIVRIMEVGVFAANCYLVACEETREGVIIDPGADPKRILSMVAGENVKIKYIINTHGHVDHISANEEVRQELGAPVLVHELDGEMYKKMPANLMAFVGKTKLEAPNRLLKGGENLSVGTLEFKVIETPGHSRGSITLHTDGALFTGDTLFAGSIGRTDLPGGSYPQLIMSIMQKLLVFPDETVVYPGHGPETTIGEEKTYNPFLR